MTNDSLLLSRLKRLERTVRRTRRLSLVLGLLVGALLLIAAQQPQQPTDLVVNTLTANQVVLNSPPLQDGKRARTRITGEGISVDGANGERAMLTGSEFAVTDGPWTVGMVASSKTSSAQVLIGGPDRDAPTVEAQYRASIEFKGGRGAFIQLVDSMNRVRAIMGAQPTTTGGTKRTMPESTFSLWAESGECLTLLPARR